MIIDWLVKESSRRNGRESRDITATCQPDAHSEVSHVIQLEAVRKNGLEGRETAAC